MMIYDILVKRKTSLDQLRTGLGILGVLEIIQRHSDSMSRYFVCRKVEMKASDLIEKLEFDPDTPPLNQSLLVEVLSGYDNDMIEKLLMYISGVNDVFSLYPNQKIKVKFTKNSDSFLGGTCDFLLNLPLQVHDIDLMKAALEAVIDGKSKRSFNTY